MENLLVNFSKHLQKLARVPFVTDALGRTYRTDDYTPVRESAPEPLVVETLSALETYISNVPDPNIEEALFIHIENYNTVSLKTTFNNKSFCERQTLITAHTPDLAKINGIFDNSLEQDTFIIALHTLFAESEAAFNGDEKEDDRSYLLRVASRLSIQTSAELSDNGMSQDATLRQRARGNLNKDETLRPIVALCPYRSFPEVSPAEGLFSFRLEKRDGHTPNLRLICADGGSWKLSTVQMIKNHLRNIGIAIPILS